MRNLLRYPVTLPEIVECLDKLADELAAGETVGDMRPVLLQEASRIVTASNQSPIAPLEKPAGVVMSDGSVRGTMTENPSDDLYGGIFWVSQEGGQMRSGTPGECAREIARLRDELAKARDLIRQFEGRKQSVADIWLHGEDP